MQFSVRIPEGSELLIKNGQSVDFNTPFIKTNQATQLKISLAKKLSIPQDKIFRHLQKFVGEAIVKGDILAVKKNFLSTKKITSPVDGVIKEIDHVEGVLIVDTHTEDKAEEQCYFKGEITGIENNKVTIKISKGLEAALKKTTQSFGGSVRYITSTSEEDFKKLEIEGCVVVAESLTAYLQAKCEALGAVGFVTLIKLPESTSIPAVVIKEIHDFKKIMNAAHTYCTAVDSLDTIYFYEA